MVWGCGVKVPLDPMISDLGLLMMLYNYYHACVPGSIAILVQSEQRGAKRCRVGPRLSLIPGNECSRAVTGRVTGR